MSNVEILMDEISVGEITLGISRFYPPLNWELGKEGRGGLIWRHEGDIVEAELATVQAALEQHGLSQFSKEVTKRLRRWMRDYTTAMQDAAEDAAEE